MCACPTYVRGQERASVCFQLISSHGLPCGLFTQHVKERASQIQTCFFDGAKVRIKFRCRKKREDRKAYHSCEW